MKAAAGVMVAMAGAGAWDMEAVKVVAGAWGRVVGTAVAVSGARHRGVAAAH